MIAVPQVALKDPVHQGRPPLPHTTQITGTINKTCGISFPKATSQLLNWPEVLSPPKLTQMIVCLRDPGSSIKTGRTAREERSYFFNEQTALGSWSDVYTEFTV